MSIGQRIKQKREILNLTQEYVAKKVGVAIQTIFKYENEIVTNIPLDKIEKIAIALETTPAYIMGWEKEQTDITPYNPIVHKIPVLGYISAGLPLYAEEHITDYTYTERNGGAEYFALKVKGDSMSAAQINDGNIIIVRKQDIVEDGEIAVIRVDDEDATVKRFKRVGDIVQLIPQSYNPEHEIQIYDLKNTEIQIIGKVVECKIEF